MHTLRVYSRILQNMHTVESSPRYRYAHTHTCGCSAVTFDLYSATFDLYSEYSPHVGSICAPWLTVLVHHVSHLHGICTTIMHDESTSPSLWSRAQLQKLSHASCELIPRVVIVPGL